MDWKISPEVQTQRDIDRLKVLQLERDDPMYGGGGFPEDKPAIEKEIDTTQRKVGTPVDDPDLIKELEAQLGAQTKQDSGPVTDPELIKELESRSKPTSFVKGVINKGVDSFNESLAEVQKSPEPYRPSNAAAGALHGATVGAATFPVSLLEGINNYVNLKFGTWLEGKGVKLSDVDTSKVINNRPISHWLNQTVKEIVGADGNKAYEYGENTVALPFSAPLQEIQERYGPGAGLLSELALGVVAAKGVAKSLYGKSKAPVQEQAATGEAPKLPTEQLELDVTTKQRGEGLPENWELNTRDSAPPFSGTKKGGIDYGRELVVDENGMPYDRARSLEQAFEEQRAGESLNRQGDMFPPEAEVLERPPIERPKHEQAWELEKVRNEVNKAAQEDIAWRGQESRNALAAESAKKNPPKTALAQAFEAAIENLYGGPSRYGKKQGGMVDPTLITGLPELVAAKAKKILKNLRGVPVSDLEQFRNEVSKYGNADLDVKLLGELRLRDNDAAMAQVQTFPFKRGERLKASDGTLFEIETLRMDPQTKQITADLMSPTTGRGIPGVTLDQLKTEYQKFGIFRGDPKQRGAIGNLNRKVAKDVEEVIDNHNTQLWLAKTGQTFSNMVMGRINMLPKDFIGFLDTLKREKDTDVISQIGLSTESHRATNPLISNLPKVSYWVQKYMSDGMALAKELGHAMDMRVKKVGLDAWNQYYNIDKAIRFTKPENIKKFQEDLRTALKMEADNSTWYQKGGNWYPTEQQLIQHGMSPESAKTWRKLYDALDVTWDTLFNTAIVNGRNPPPRIPGYLPHVVKGPYKVQVVEQMQGGAQPIELFHWNSGHWSAAEAKNTAARIKELLAQDPQYAGLEIRTPRPDIVKDNAAAIIEGLMQAKDITQGNAQLVKLLNRVYEGAAQGIVTHALNRQKIPAAGHILDRAAMTPAPIGTKSWIYQALVEDRNAGLTPRQIRQAAETMQEMMQAVNGWYVRSRYVNDFLFPMDAMGFFKDRPVLQNNVKSYLDGFFKINDLGEGRTARFLADKFVSMGLDPALGQKIINTMHSGFSKWYLLLKPAFWAANSVQQMQGLPMLLNIKAFGDIAKESTGSISKAYTESLPHLFSIHTKKQGGSTVVGKTSAGRDVTIHEIIEEANRRGHTDPTFMEAVDPGMFKDPVAIAIERNTRANSFILGYNYFKQILPHERALEAAGKFSDAVSVPYSRDVGAPIATAKGGMLSQVFSMFTTYNIHQFGVLAQQIRLNSLASNLGNNAALSKAFTAAVGLQALQLSMFGVGGIALVSNWDAIADYFNQHFGTSLPTAKEAVKEILEDNKTLAKGVAYGALSNAMQVDVSSSGAGPSLSLPLAGINAIDVAGAGLMLALRELALSDSKKPSQKEIKKWIEKNPPQWKAPLEALLTDRSPYAEAFGNLADKKKAFVPQPEDPNLAFMKRDEWDATTHALGGRSLTESNALNDLSIWKRHQDIAEFEIEKGLQLLREGRISKGTKEEIIANLNKKYWSNPDKFISEIQKYAIAKRLTFKERSAMAAGNSMSSAHWFKEWMIINGGRTK